MINTLLIAELLQSHDCVILPELGAFLTHHRAASVHIIDKQIFPPHKTISFNSSLLTNDGLLIHLVATKMNCSYEHAQTLVLQQCSIWQTKMMMGEVLQFENVGNLWMDLNKKIQFKSVGNFLNSANYFGLQTLTIEPIFRHEIKENVIAEFVREDDKGLHPQGYLNSFIKEEKKVKPFKKYYQYAIAAMAVGAIAFGSWMMVQQQSTFDFASIISIDSFFNREKIAVKKNKILSEKKNVEANPLSEKHPYTFYLSNPAEPYYLITDTNLNLTSANEKKLHFWREGYDARIIQMDSTYQIGIYEFATKSDIQQIKNATDSLLHIDSKLMKILN